MQRNQISRLVLIAAFCSLDLLFSFSSLAADRYFTNVLGGNFTNKTLWMTGIVPTNNDRVFFTNNTARQIDFTMNATNASVFFSNSVATTFTGNVASSTWYVTNQFAAALVSGSTSSFILTSGTIVVTNGAGTASVVAGGAGKGTISLFGGDMIVDHIYQTNYMNSDIDIDFGSTLTILGDSRFSTNNTSSVMIIGSQSSSLVSSLIVLGGTTAFEDSTVIVGNSSGSKGNLTVSGSGIVTSDGTIDLGNTGSGSHGEIWVTNGGKVFGLNGLFMDSGWSNLVVISGSGSTMTNAQELYVGEAGSSSFNLMIVSNGGFYSTRQLIVGSAGNSNGVIVTDGGHFHGGTIGHNIGSSSSSNSYFIVTGAGSIADFEQSLSMGANSTGIKSTLIVSNGGGVSNVRVRLGNIGGENNILVSDVGSYITNTGRSWLGVQSGTNTFTISNGGAYYGFQFQISSNDNAINNKLVIDGYGSIMRLNAGFLVGSNDDIGFGKGSVIIQNEGTLQTPSITNGYSGFGEITNFRGVYQFATADPNIVTNAGGHIVITNGTISFKSINNAPVFITNDLSRLTWQGSNSYMLNEATNAIFSSYTFTNGLGATNYNQLVLMGSGSMWQATNILMGVGASIYYTNTTASTFGLITNSGAIQIAGPATTVTNLGNVVLTAAGTILNLSGTNTFDGPVFLAGNAKIQTLDDYLTMNGTLTNNGSLLTVSNAANSTLEIGSLISGTGGLTHTGAGKLSLSSSNSFSGNITNNLGTLSIDQTYAISGLTGSTIVNGGTLLFNVSATNTTAGVILNGGTIQETDTNLSLGALTVSANSTVQLGSGGGIGRIRFASGTNTVGSGAKLTIYGWSWNSGLTGGSDDLIFFTSTSFETASFLNNVTFFGTGGGARVLSSGELVPITPEPSSIVSGSILIILMVKRLKRRSL